MGLLAEAPELGRNSSVFWLDSELGIEPFFELEKRSIPEPGIERFLAQIRSQFWLQIGTRPLDPEPRIQADLDPERDPSDPGKPQNRGFRRSRWSACWAQDLRPDRSSDRLGRSSLLSSEFGARTLSQIEPGVL